MFAIRPVARAASRLVGGKTEPPFDFASLFKNGEQGLWLDPSLNIKDGWRVNHVVSTTNPALWLDPLNGTHTINSDGSYTIKLLIESTSGIGLGARSQYPVGASIDTDKTIYRSVEVKKVDAHIVRFGAAADGKAVFVDLNTLEVVRNGGQVDARITDLGDGFVRIEIFTYSATALGATGVSNLIGWGNSRNIATLAETINTSLTLRKPVYAVLGGNVTQAPTYQEIVNADAAFLEAHPKHSMFQDAAATVPVLLKAQPVGLMLDKSKNLIIGANVSLVTSAFKDADGVKYIQILNNIAYAGKFFKIKFKLNSVTSERSIFFEGVNGGTVKYLTDLRTEFVIRAGATGVMRMGGLSAALFDFSDIEVREIFGNHAYQIKSSARPILQDNVQFDPVEDALNVMFESALTNCTLVTVKHGEQAQILENQSIAQNHVINEDFMQYLLINRSLTDTERTQILDYFNKIGAAT